MPKAQQRYYAVRIGREGPKIYDSWEHTKPHILGFSGASSKSFTSLAQAEAWLKPMLRSATYNPRADSTVGSPSMSCSVRESEPFVPPLRPTLEAETMSMRTVSQEIGHQEFTRSANLVSMGDTGPPADSPEPSIQLSSEQQEILDMVKDGKSVFLQEPQVAVTATTGIASINIGGSTVHSWAGVGLAKEEVEELLGKIFGIDRRLKERQQRERKEKGLPSDAKSDYLGKTDTAVGRWRMVNVLVIDEISMMDGRVFDKLEYIARRVRNSAAPFGGIQLVLSGDFCQLPPVWDEVHEPAPPLFAFEAQSWYSCVGKPLALHKVYRQAEQCFVDMLNAMRFGVVTSSTVDVFTSLSREVKYDDGIGPTELFPTRREVDTANMTKLRQLDTERQVYIARDKPIFNENGRPPTKERLEKLLDKLVAQKAVVLKIGAQVMLLKNFIQGRLVNGSIGLVERFCTAVEALKDGAILGTTDGYGAAKESPWSILAAYKWFNEHKDVYREFEMREKLQRRRRAVGWAISDEVVQLLDSRERWPVVRFGKTRVVCVRAHFDVTDAQGRMEALRVQVPLILAWALSMHKAQGQTLERVRVNMRCIFVPGQAYAALSRATSIERLEVLNFAPRKVSPHPGAYEWMSQNHLVPLSILASVEELRAMDAALVEYMNSNQADNSEHHQ